VERTNIEWYKTTKDNALKDKALKWAKQSMGHNIKLQTVGKTSPGQKSKDTTYDQMTYVQMIHLVKFVI